MEVDQETDPIKERAKLFVQRLPRKPNLLEDLLQSLEQEDDRFVCKVMSEAREQGIVWEELNDPIDELEFFEIGNRGVEVIKEWLMMLKDRMKVSETVTLEDSETENGKLLIQVLADFQLLNHLKICPPFPE